MNGFQKTITGTILGAAFAAHTAFAQDDGNFPVPENSTVFASAECIEKALKQTFGPVSIDNNAEYGLITAGTMIDGKPILAEIYLGFQEAVASLNVTMIDGVATMKDNNGALEFQAAAQGTASLFYRGAEGILELSLQGYDPLPLKTFINTLDREIRSCAPSPLVG